MAKDLTLGGRDCQDVTLPAVDIIHPAFFLVRGFGSAGLPWRQSLKTRAAIPGLLYLHPLLLLH